MKAQKHIPHISPCGHCTVHIAFTASQICHVCVFTWSLLWGAKRLCWTLLLAYFRLCAPPLGKRVPWPASRPRYRACRPGLPWLQCAAGLGVWPSSAGELDPRSWVAEQLKFIMWTVQVNSLICEQTGIKWSIIHFLYLNLFNILAKKTHNGLIHVTNNVKSKYLHSVSTFSEESPFIIWCFKIIVEKTPQKDHIISSFTVTNQSNMNYCF